MLEVACEQDRDHEEVVAALGALRVASGAQRLVTLEDLRGIGRLTRGGTKDVRIAALRVLGECVGSDEALMTLLNCAEREDLKADEYRQIIRGLGRTGQESVAAHGHLVRQASRRLKSGVEKKGAAAGAESIPFGRPPARPTTLVELLRALRDSTLEIPPALASELQRAIKGHQFEAFVKAECLLTLVATATPAGALVEFLVQLIESPASELTSGACSAVTAFIRRIRRRLDHVRSVYPWLESLGKALRKRYDRVSKSEDSADDSRAEELRRSIEQVESLLHSYDEFAVREDSAAPELGAVEVEAEADASSDAEVETDEDVAS
jgi:hypothetical protein